MPEALARAKPAFQDGFFVDDDLGGSIIVYVDLVSIADRDVPGLGKLAAAERVTFKRGDNIR